MVLWEFCVKYYSYYKNFGSIAEPYEKYFTNTWETKWNQSSQFKIKSNFINVINSANTMDILLIEADISCKICVNLTSNYYSWIVSSQKLIIVRFSHSNISEMVTLFWTTFDLEFFRLYITSCNNGLLNTNAFKTNLHRNILRFELSYQLHKSLY